MQSLSVGQYLEKMQTMVNESCAEEGTLRCTHDDTKAYMVHLRGKLSESRNILRTNLCEFTRTLSHLNGKMNTFRDKLKNEDQTILSQLSLVKCDESGLRLLSTCAPYFESIYSNVSSQFTGLLSEGKDKLPNLVQKIALMRTDLLNILKQLRMSALLPEVEVLVGVPILIPQQKFGYIFLELVTPSKGLGTERFKRSLIQLLEPHWSTRVSVTETITKTLLQLSSSTPTRNGTVIWPTYRLVVPFSNSCTTEQLSIPDAMYSDCRYSNKSLIDILRSMVALHCKLHSLPQISMDDIVDPVSLLEWNNTLFNNNLQADLEKVLKKAVGQWIFVADDNVGTIVMDLLKQCNDNTLERKFNLLLDNHQKAMLLAVNGCITAAGRRHVLGSLYVQNFKELDESVANCTVEMWRKYCLMSCKLNEIIESLANESKALEHARSQVVMLKKDRLETGMLLKSLVEFCSINIDQAKIEEQLLVRHAKLEEEILSNEAKLKDLASLLKLQKEGVRVVLDSINADGLSECDPSSLLSDKCSELRAYHTKLNELKSEVERLDGEIIAYEVDVASSTPDAIELKLNIFTVQLSDLQSSIDECKQKLEQLELNTSELNKKLQNLNSQLESNSKLVIGERRLVSKAKAVLNST